MNKITTNPLLNGRHPPLQLSALGFGAASLGGLYHPCTEENAHELVTQALALGLSTIDTAPWYGFGQSESYLGRSLAGVSRERFTLSSKVGRLLREDAPVHPSQLDDHGHKVFVTSSPYNVIYDYSYDGVTRSVEDSLRRLGLDVLDTAYIHDPDVEGITTRELLGGAIPALRDLRDQGVIRAYGAGMNQIEQLAEIVREGDPDAVLLAGRYTLLEQGALDELLPLCQQQRVSVVIGGVYNSGLLTDPASGKYNYSEAPGALRARAQRLQAVCARYGVPLKAAALQFVAAHPAVLTTLVGLGQVAHLQDTVNMWNTPIALECWQELRQEGLIRPDAPTPLVSGSGVVA